MAKPSWKLYYHSALYYADVHWYSRKWRGSVAFDAVQYRAWTRNGIGRKVNRAVKRGTTND